MSTGAPSYRVYLNTEKAISEIESSGVYSYCQDTEGV